MSAFSFSMLHVNKNRERAEIIWDGVRSDVVSYIAREEATTRNTRMDLRPLPNWTLNYHCRKCAGMMDMKRFDAMALECRNLVIYDRNRFESDTALGACKRRWTVLSSWRVRTLVDTWFADISFFRCKQDFSYCSKLRDATDANVKIAEGFPELQCLLLEKLVTNMYLRRGGTH